jgi:putative redox protein
MKVTATWQGGRHFEAVGQTGYKVQMDAGPADGGNNRGNRPMELILMGLVGCTGIDVAMILERMREPLESLDIEASGTRREEHPRAFTEIHLTYRMTGNISPQKAWRAIHLSEEKYCSASASLNATIVPHLVLNGEVFPSDRFAEYEKGPSD